ncbi:MAG: HAD-IB family hydrolase [Chloroflexi bacterium]|nr:HAD-IB family hydrolase [Chloroflexota bacterium]
MTSAVFTDMEGTLTTGSAPRLFVEVGARLGIFSRWEVFKMVVINLVGKPIPRSSRLRTKVYYFTLTSLIKGHTLAEMERINAVVGPELLQKVKPGSLARIREHQQAGLPVVVVSAGAQEMVAAFAKALGATSGEGTRLVHKEGIYTGAGEEVCQGEGKAQRIKQVAAERGYELSHSYGYGDTLPDVAFLELVGHPAVVDPEPELAAVAQQRGWRVIQNNEPAT